MKPSIAGCAVAALLSFVSVSYADYRVTFSTLRSDAPGYASNPVFEVDGVTRLDNNYRATLWVGSSSAPASLTLAGPAATFLTDQGVAGNFSGHIDGDTYGITDPVLSLGGTGFYQIRAWRASDGATFGQANATLGAHTGVSAVTSYTVGGQPPGSPAPPPTDVFSTFHPSFSLSIVPEPSVLALGLLGGAALLFRRRK